MSMKFQTYDIYIIRYNGSFRAKCSIFPFCIVTSILLYFTLFCAFSCMFLRISPKCIKLLNPVINNNCIQTYAEITSTNFFQIPSHAGNKIPLVSTIEFPITTDGTSENSYSINLYFHLRSSHSDSTTGFHPTDIQVLPLFEQNTSWKKQQSKSNLHSLFLKLRTYLSHVITCRNALHWLLWFIREKVSFSESFFLTQTSSIRHRWNVTPFWRCNKEKNHFTYCTYDKSLLDTIKSLSRRLIRVSFEREQGHSLFNPPPFASLNKSFNPPISGLRFQIHRNIDSEGRGSVAKVQQQDAWLFEDFKASFTRAISTTVSRVSFLFSKGEGVNWRNSCARASLF